jgi:hypothetical protein
MEHGTKVQGGPGVFEPAVVVVGVSLTLLLGKLFLFLRKLFCSLLHHHHPPLGFDAFQARASDAVGGH